MAFVFKGDTSKIVKEVLMNELEELKKAAIKKAVNEFENDLNKKMAKWALDISKYYNIENVRGDIMVTVKSIK